RADRGRRTTIGRCRSARCCRGAGTQAQALVTESPFRLLTRLSDAGVDFVVIGAIAVQAHGHIRTTRDLDITYSTEPANFDALGSVLVALDARLRGVADVVPFIPDGRTLRATEMLTLTTPQGALDLLASPPGAPPYPELRARAE